ncbi:response regulator [Bacteriovoracaceae bacterium]|nr:response regulator [Bacteriovoracaceae bacterium]
MPKVLIVEDEDDIRELIHFNLYKEKYEVVEAGNGEEALKLFKTEKPDLVLLDIMLPLMSGLEICRKIKEDSQQADTKIIFVSAKGAEEDIITGLELGADDYVTKPFSPKVLVARVKSVLRRKKFNEDQEVISCHNITMDTTLHKVTVDQDDIALSVTEYQILKVFLQGPGRVYSRANIVKYVKGSNYAVTDRSVDTQIVSLRKKLKEAGKLIETVWGIGYRFKEIT